MFRGEGGLDKGGVASLLGRLRLFRAPVWGDTANRGIRPLCWGGGAWWKMWTSEAQATSGSSRCVPSGPREPKNKTQPTLSHDLSEATRTASLRYGIAWHTKRGGGRRGSHPRTPTRKRGAPAPSHDPKEQNMGQIQRGASLSTTTTTAFPLPLPSFCILLFPLLHATRGLDNEKKKKGRTLLDLCVSSLRRGHAVEVGKERGGEGE